MRQKKFLMSLLAILSLSAGLCLGACSSETDPEGDPQTDADASVTPGQDDASEPGTGPVGEVPLPEGGLRVSVIDELTRRPVLGATVVASVGGVEHALTAQDDERYLAIVDSDAAATVSVFHADYHYVTKGQGIRHRDPARERRRGAEAGEVQFRADGRERAEVGRGR